MYISLYNNFVVYYSIVDTYDYIFRKIKSSGLVYYSFNYLINLKLT